MAYKDPERKKAYDAKYYRENIERHRAYHIAWVKANPEKARAYGSAWKKAHPENERIRAAKWRKANPEKVKAILSKWEKANPEKIRTKNSTRRARKMEAFVENVDAEAIFVRDGGVCQICDKFIGQEKWHVDHCIPLSRGGEHSYRNCELTHARCNLVKGAKTP